MKKQILLLLIVTSSIVYGQRDSIHFTKGNWIDILYKAKKENKPIFVDCYTTWCGPCKWMAANVFTEINVASYYNTNFICYKADMGKDDSIIFMKQFDIQGFPTFLYLDSDGHPLHKVIGIMEPSDFITIAEDAFDSAKSFYAIRNKYINGDRTPEELYDYLMAVNKSSSKLGKYINQETDTLADEYFKTQTYAELLEQKNWLAIKESIYSINDTMFHFVLHHKSDYIRLYDSVDVYSFLYQINLMDLQFNHYIKNDTSQYNISKAILFSYNNTSIYRKVINNDWTIGTKTLGIDIDLEK